MSLSREFSVNYFTMHPDYNDDLIVYDYDILRLTGNIPFTSTANAVCLSKSEIPINSF